MINAIYQLVSPKVFSVKYEDLALDAQVIVRPRCMAVCHADQRYFLGQRDRKVLSQKLPMALIHEGCGEVVCDATGTYRPGTKVVMIPNAYTEIDDVILENYRLGSYFLSSGHDGFMREFVSLPPDRVVPYTGVPDTLAAITEFVSVACHALSRFDRAAHARRTRVGIWGDGSLAYTVACVMRALMPDKKISVVGLDARKLSHFAFADETHFADHLPEDFAVDHAFECCGGEGASYAIDDIIGCINPQGTVMLMGVSENKVAVNTRSILEKGLTLVGCSRSGRADFERAVSLMETPVMQNRLSVIVEEDAPVRSVADLSRVFVRDLTNPFKTVFRWEM